MHLHLPSVEVDVVPEDDFIRKRLKKGVPPLGGKMNSHVSFLTRGTG